MSIADGLLFMGNHAYGVIWDFMGGRYRFWYIERGSLMAAPVEVSILSAS
jgi:hypothetical protein